MKRRKGSMSTPRDPPAARHACGAVVARRRSGAVCAGARRTRRSRQRAARQRRERLGDRHQTIPWQAHGTRRSAGSHRRARVLVAARQYRPRLAGTRPSRTPRRPLRPPPHRPGTHRTPPHHHRRRPLRRRRRRGALVAAGLRSQPAAQAHTTRDDRLSTAGGDQPARKAWRSATATRWTFAGRETLESTATAWELSGRSERKAA